MRKKEKCRKYSYTGSSHPMKAGATQFLYIESWQELFSIFYFTSVECWHLSKKIIVYPSVKQFFVAVQN